MRLRALNDEGARAEAEVTKEATEARDAEMYTAGLEAQKRGELQEAVTIYEKLLAADALAAVRPVDGEEQSTAAVLKYCTLKNLGQAYQLMGEPGTAVGHLVQASAYDATGRRGEARRGDTPAAASRVAGSRRVLRCFRVPVPRASPPQASPAATPDVSLWNRIGSVAVTLPNYALARYAFEQALECSPLNWPCMEKLSCVLFSLGDVDPCRSLLKRWVTGTSRCPDTVVLSLRH